MNRKRISALRIVLLFAITTPATPAFPQSEYWQQTGAPANDYVTSVAFDSGGSGYAATIYGGVFRSTDAGAHWTRVNAGLPGYFVSALAGLPDTSVLAGAPEGVYSARNPGLGWGPAGWGDL